MSAVQTLSYAQAGALALQQAMQADATVVALGEDRGRGGVFGQYRGLQQQFGAERVIDTPISEANIMGAAVGMALAGLRPVMGAGAPVPVEIYSGKRLAEFARNNEEALAGYKLKR